MADVGQKVVEIPIRDDLFSEIVDPLQFGVVFRKVEPRLIGISKSRPLEAVGLFMALHTPNPRLIRLFA